MDLAQGTVVGGRYVVRRLLGRGGMGAVYEALDTKFAAPVALKVAAASGAAHEEFRARFVREARIGHRLGRTQGFVRALDWGPFGEQDPRLWLALDLVTGARPLELEQGTPRERLLRVARAARLVAEAHRQGVIHRDLKPTNFLVAEDGAIALADFGLAKVLGAPPTEEDDLLEPTGGLTESLVAMGTPRYMAPEQFEDSKRVDARADLFALGVMLFVALTGQHPYGGRRAVEVIRAQTLVKLGQAPAPRPRAHAPDVDETLDGLCARALALDPAERLADAGALAAALEAAVAALPDEAAAPRRRRGDRRDGDRRAGDRRQRERRPRAADVTRFELPPAPQERLHEKTGATLVWVPPGSFVMGARRDDDSATKDERPQHRVHLTKGVWLGRTPVTFGQLARFCAATGAAPPDRRIEADAGETLVPGPARVAVVAGDDFAAFHVTWDEARAYCAWASLRLPTEAEWEWAARGPDGRPWPWGDAPADATRLVAKDHADGPRPAGALPAGASPFGLLDLAGGVWEWVDDAWSRYAKGAVTDPRVEGPPGAMRVVRGGSWSTPVAGCRATARRVMGPGMRAANLGFRVALDASAPS